MSEELTLGSHDSLTAKHSFLIWNTQINMVNFTFVVPTLSLSYSQTQLKHIPEKSSMKHTQAPVFGLNALCLLTWLQLGWKSEAGCAALHTQLLLLSAGPSWYSPERHMVNNKQSYRKSKAFVIIQEFRGYCRSFYIYHSKVCIYQPEKKKKMVKKLLHYVCKTM